MSEPQIKRMVDRFLAWKLPENFNPDGGISFDPIRHQFTKHPEIRQPTGTNLLDAQQAEAMVRHMIEGVVPTWQPIETAPKDGTSLDLWAQDAETGRYRRVPDCWWGRCTDILGNDHPAWIGLYRGPHRAHINPTHWMPTYSPEPPNA